MIVTCSKCNAEMEIDTVNGEQYITEQNGNIHHVHDCTVTAGE